METRDENQKRDQRLKPGQKSLTIKLPESGYRAFRAKAVALGLKNDEFLLKLVELEEAHPIQ